MAKKYNNKKKNRKSPAAYLRIPGDSKFKIHGWLFGIFTCAMVVLILSPNVHLPAKHYSVGDIATKNIKAADTYLVEDENATALKRIEARDSVLPIYDYDERLAIKQEEKLSKAFAFIRDFWEQWEKSAPEEMSQEQLIKREADLEEARKKFGEILDVNVYQEDFDFLSKIKFRMGIQNFIQSQIRQLLDDGVVDNREVINRHLNTGIVLRNIDSKAENTHKDFSAYHSLNEANEIFRVETEMFLDANERFLLSPVTNIIQGLNTPNITFNKNETEERRKMAVESVKPVLYRIEKGEMIIREGEKISEETLLKLKGADQKRHDAYNILILLGIAVFVLLIYYVIYSFTLQGVRRINLDGKNAVFLGAMLIIALGFLRLAVFLSGAIYENFTYAPMEAYTYGVPLAAFAMIVCLVLHVEVAVAFSFIMSILAALLLGNSLFYFAYFLVGSLVGSAGVRVCRERKTILRAGTRVGIFQVLMILCIVTIKGQPINTDVLALVIMGFAGGIFAAVVVSGVVPLVEVVFGYTTDIKLLELANLDHPLLKELSIMVPGTYYHSIMVANMVEAAAETVGANPLLAKVSALYHDIGKIKRPNYFIENLREKEENPHDKQSPNMSALILVSHVKDGLEMARDYKLGKTIEDIIQQHHGTNMMNFFYEKSKEQANGNPAQVSEEDFRYPGPKPQTLEAALVMLADSIEAASRTLKDTYPARIQGMIQKIINRHFSDGQLDECDITLSNLHEIAKTFNTLLSSVYHQRVDYPQPAYKEKKKVQNGDIDKKSAKGDQDESDKDKEDRPEDLKRLGL